jgi:hypothetical protein
LRAPAIRARFSGTMANEVKFDENLACDRCGRFGAYQFDGERVCAECYELRGSCCPEFGADDLWRPAEQDSARVCRSLKKPAS